MSTLSLKDLIENGVHFGHRSSRWNPRMKPYIFGKRNTIHIINLKETVRGIVRGRHFLKQLVARGEDVLLIGTKRSAKEVIRAAGEKTQMPYAAERWIGGTFTNFETVKSRVARLDKIEQMEKTGTINQYSKKVIAKLQREKRKLLRNLAGIRTMHRLPGAVVVVDPKKEHNAVAEARRLNIPVVAVLDTDCDPALVDIPIPANDDAMRSVTVIFNQLAEAIEEGKKQRRTVSAPSAPARNTVRPTAGRAPAGKEEKAPAAAATATEAK